MDKVYPRLMIKKLTCHCGAVSCKKMSELPWRVYHVQYEGQGNPVTTFESRTYETAREHAALKVDASLSRQRKHKKATGLNGAHSPVDEQYYITAV